MAEQKRQIFRSQSLEKLSSPERLDQLLRVVRPQNWILLMSIGAGLVLVGIWSVYGRIPVTATGSAILVRPKQVVSFHSRSAGSIEEILVGVGDDVQEGETLAVLYLPTLRKQLDQERARRLEFEQKSGELTELEKALAEQELEFIASQRTLIHDRITSVNDSANRAWLKSDAYLSQQRTNLADARADSEELGAALADLLAALEGLEDLGMAPRDRVIEAERDVFDNNLALAQLRVREAELDLYENTSQESFDEQMDLVRDLGMRLGDLEIRELAISGSLRENEINNDSVIQEIDRRVAELEVQLESEGTIRSKYAGRVLEVTAFVGQHVAIGERVGKMEIENPDATLMALAYFRVKDGKKVLSDQPIRVSPATVERERFGGILGQVEAVSEYPVTIDAAATQIGDKEIARTLLAGESRIEVTARLDMDESAFTGFRWTSGTGPDDHRITAGTTGEARVTIEERAPITLILPFLKSLTGL